MYPFLLKAKKIDVVGTSKGKGYSGVMKRWNFGGGEVSHGSKFHRGLGSTGMNSYPAKVFKGKKRCLVNMAMQESQYKIPK